VRLLSALAALVALATAAWFALGVRQAVDVSRASSLLSQQAFGPAQADRAGSLLSSASTLNPDSTVDLLRASLAVRTGQAQRARSILLRLAGREPLNVLVWFEIAQTSSGDPALQRTALSHVAQLHPNVAH